MVGAAAAGGGGRGMCLCVYSFSRLAFTFHRTYPTKQKKNGFSSKVTGFHLHPRAVLTSEVAVVGWHHQQLSLGVLDNVTPVDGVRMAQEFVLVHVNTSIQYLCTERGRKKEKERNEHIAMDI